MNSLYVLVESFTNGFRVESLDVISLISVLCGIFVIITKNPIVSVLFLIGLFFSISNYLILLGLNFIGLSYLLVYVGAISILFLFILMLINVRVSELLSNTSNSIPLAIIIAISYNYPVNNILPYSIAVYNSFNLNLSNIINSVEYGSSGAYSDNLFKGIEHNNGEVFFATSKV
jgi:NADH-ubiquinone oxidoreductase chain 6